MKIVHIITRMILGGAQENTILSCEALHRRGYEVTLITGPPLGPEGQLMDRARSGGYKVIELASLRRAINPFFDLPCYFQLKKLLLELGPDIVHTHSAKAGILGRLAAWKLRKKKSEKSFSPRIIHTIHGLAFHPYQRRIINRIYITIERFTAKRTDSFICVANAMTKKSLAASIGRPEQYTTVYSGLEIENYLTPPPPERIAQIRRQMNIQHDAFVITTIARLFKLKGHEFIIESARQLAPRHKNLIWLFIGDGILHAKIASSIADAGIQDKFRLIGLVPPERIGELLHGSDILVHCSLREGLARALPQAMLCGKPVVSFDIDGAAEVVINDKTGFLIPPCDVSKLTGVLDKLITHPDILQRISDTCRDFCRKDFDYEVMVDKIEQVYKTLTL